MGLELIFLFCQSGRMDTSDPDETSELTNELNFFEDLELNFLFLQAAGWQCVEC